MRTSHACNQEKLIFYSLSFNSSGDLYEMNFENIAKFLGALRRYLDNSNGQPKDYEFDINFDPLSFSRKPDADKDAFIERVRISTQTNLQIVIDQLNKWEDFENLDNAEQVKKIKLLYQVSRMRALHNLFSLINLSPVYESLGFKFDYTVATGGSNRPNRPTRITSFRSHGTSYSKRKKAEEREIRTRKRERERRERSRLRLT